MARSSGCTHFNVDTGSLASGMKALGTMVVVEIILLLAFASLSGVPSGTARLVLRGLAASTGMRSGIFKFSFSKSPWRSCQLAPFAVASPMVVPIKSFEGFAARFLGISLLDLNDGRRVLEGFQLELRKRHRTQAAR